jgi:hypothetical protein
MKNPINQLQEGVNKIQSIVEDFDKTRRESRIKEQMLNDEFSALCRMLLNDIKEGRTV